MRFLWSLVIALGVSLGVGGSLSFLFGLVEKEPLYVHTCCGALGWLEGYWWPGQYCVLGAVLAAVGAGLITLGVLNRKRAVGGG